MPLLGQASGAWTESSSALRLLHVGVRNTVGILTNDAFTQTNPPIFTAANTISTQVDTSVLGVLSGSVAFTRPDQGANYIGGNAVTLAVAAHEFLVRPLGCFINNAAGYSYENLPAAASGKGPYVSGMGTYGNALFETQFLAASTGGGAQGNTIAWVTGTLLIASLNGYLMPYRDSTNAGLFANAGNCAEVEHGWAAADVTMIGLLKMPADATQNEIVFDQRI